MQNIDVLIVFENKGREYESSLILKAAMELRGYSAEVVQLCWSEQLARWKYAPSVIVTPWFYDDVDYDYYTSYVGGLRDHGLKVVNLHCEQVVREDTVDWYIPKGRAAESYHCAWGPWFRDALLRAGVSENKVRITGSPRLDLFRKEFVVASKDELASQYGLDPAKPWLLLVGNFSGAFFDETALSRLRSRGLSNAEAFRDTTIRAYGVILDWLADACSQDDIAQCCNIIYRPHPSEPVSPELQALGDTFGCLKIVRDLSIREWFQVCDAAFTWCSTSSVEAVCANIPIVSLRPFEIPEEQRIDLVEHLEQLTTKESFIAAVRAALKDGGLETSEDFIREMSKFYSIDPEVLSTERTADFIADCLHDGEEPLQGRCFIPPLALYQGLKWLARRLLLATGMMGRIKRFVSEVNNVLTPEEIARAERIVESYKLRRTGVDVS